MVAIGRALIARPKLLVCDELSLGLAPVLVQQLLATIGETCRASGAACLLIEQNARLALSFCDYVYVLEAGRVAISGPSEDLRSDAAVMESYLGTASGVAAATDVPVRKPTEEGPMR